MNYRRRYLSKFSSSLPRSRSFMPCYLSFFSWEYPPYSLPFIYKKVCPFSTCSITQIARDRVCGSQIFHSNYQLCHSHEMSTLLKDSRWDLQHDDLLPWAVKEPENTFILLQRWHGFGLYYLAYIYIPWGGSGHAETWRRDGIHTLRYGGTVSIDERKIIEEKFRTCDPCVPLLITAGAGKLLSTMIDYQNIITLSRRCGPQHHYGIHCDSAGGLIESQHWAAGQVKSASTRTVERDEIFSARFSE